MLLLKIKVLLGNKEKDLRKEIANKMNLNKKRDLIEKYDIKQHLHLVLFSQVHLVEKLAVLIRRVMPSSTLR
jgi:hypothetical protein